MWATSKMECRTVKVHLPGLSGAVYEGEWKDNKRNGHGTYKWSNGDVYEGEWKNNQPNGKGTFHFDERNQI